MADVFTKKKRSQVMSLIRGAGNKDTELVLAKIMRKSKIHGWRRNQPLIGRPDFTFHRERLIVFVDGCFCIFVLSTGAILEAISHIEQKSATEWSLANLEMKVTPLFRSINYYHRSMF